MLVNLSDYMNALLEKQDIIAAKQDSLEAKVQSLIEENDSYLIDVAMDRVPGVTMFKKAGGNPTIGTTQRAINWGNTPVNIINTPSVISFSSSSALDTSTGTGARSILIIGIDGLGNYQTEVLILNGTSSVTTTKTWLKILNRVQVYQAGVLLNNQGTITGVVGGDTVCTMPPSTGLMKQLAYVVPNGNKALIHSYFLDASKNNVGGSQKVDIFFYILMDGVKYELFNIRIDQSTGVDVFVLRKYESPLPILAGSIWWLEAKADSSTFWLDGEIEQTIHEV